MSISSSVLGGFRNRISRGDVARNRRMVQQIRSRVKVLESLNHRTFQSKALEFKEEILSSCQRLRGNKTGSFSVRNGSCLSLFNQPGKRATRLLGSEQQIMAFALITEAVRRALGKMFYDVQLMGGIELAGCCIAQMQTGEGKTLTTALPAYLHALTGAGVHVATTNAYLAERDCEELRPAFELLGIGVGLLPEGQELDLKRKAYRCDITFGTGYEFGFDFLRDQIGVRGSGQVPLGFEHLLALTGRERSCYQPLQRSHYFTIVDEADSVLIDEATMPLILSSAGGESVPEEIYELAEHVAGGLVEDEDFELEETSKQIAFSDEGWQKLHADLVNRENLPLQRQWLKYVQNALHARFFLHRDVDYVVREGEVQIIDQHTGRIHEERTWRDGLHQAIERKEKVEITPETASDARVTRQRYFQQYECMAGMTGTAEGVEDELKSFYGLRTVLIPTHRPCIRERWQTRSFRDSSARNAAIVQEVKEVVSQGRPVLVGTRTILHSLELSTLMHEAGFSHTVLNGVQDEEEALIVSQAGQSGTITIATNMAGRGTDIKPDDQSLSSGGLHVIGAEQNLSSRVDRQLCGRAARQGNPGSYRFFASAEDEIFQYRSSVAEKIRNHSQEDGECRRDMTRDIARIQSALEQSQFESRRAMVSRDYWLDDILETLASIE